MLLIAWDLDGTLLRSDVVPPPGGTRHRVVTLETGMMYVFVRPHAYEALEYFMSRPDEYCSVLFSAAHGEYVDAMVEDVLYAGLDEAYPGSRHHFDAVYSRDDMIEGKKLVESTCRFDGFQFDDSVLIDDMWVMCATTDCRTAACVPPYDPYAGGDDRALLQILSKICERAKSGAGGEQRNQAVAEIWSPAPTAAPSPSSSSGTA